MEGVLNIVSTPIGDYSDITLRALRILNESDCVIWEELLRFFEIKKELKSLNEHNETDSSDEIFLDLLNGKNLSIISDCGTPVFSDPGSIILQKCIDANIKIEFIGGANSVIASIVLSGFDISRFYYAGFLSPKSEIRKKELQSLKYLKRTIVLMEAPYRLKAILQDIKDIFVHRKIFVAFDLTMQSEKKFRGNASEILDTIGEDNLKGEFLIIIDKYSD